MKINISVFLIIISSLTAYAQIDRVYLHPDYILYKGDTLSQFDKNGLKQGNWIECDVNNIILVHVPRICDSIREDGSIIMSNDYVTEYYSRNKNKNNSNCDSAFSNMIPPDVIEYLSFGYYLNDNKSGKWNTYDKNENLYKEFNYENGIPVDSFYLYYTNGNIKAKGKVNLNNNTFSFEKYSENGEHVKTRIYEIEEIKRLL